MNSSQIILSLGLCVFGAVLLVLNEIHRRRQIARGIQKAQQRQAHLRREEEAGFPPSAKDYHFAVAFDGEKVTVSDLCTGRQPVSVRWAEVVRASVFKRDLFSVDCICLFLARTDDSGIELNEDMAQWQTFATALPKYLPGCRPLNDWYAKVALPPFEPNPAEIWSRGVHQPA